jgi:hypothetical protein
LSSVRLVVIGVLYAKAEVEEMIRRRLLPEPKKTLDELIAAVQLPDEYKAAPLPTINQELWEKITAGIDFTPRPELTQERLKEVVDYDPETGIFRWKKRPKGGAKIGDVAGWLNYVGDNYARVYISIDTKHYLAHSLVWLYVYGRFPEGEIDHIDRNGTNNRLNNLIEADRSIQLFNSKLQDRNRSGHKGIDWFSYDNRHNKWRARITYRGKVRCLGYYKTFEEAVAARQAAEIKLLGCLTTELSDPKNRHPRPMEVAMPKPMRTYFDVANAEVDENFGGRFSKLTKPTVVGSSPTPVYPQQPGSSPANQSLVAGNTEELIDATDLPIPTGEIHEQLRSQNAPSEATGAEPTSSVAAISGDVGRFRRRI